MSKNIPIMWILAWLVIAAFAQDVPTRTMPPEIPEPTKKVKKANDLRAQVKVLENAHRQDMEELGSSISNKISSLNFSTSRFDVKIKSVSWMHEGLAQITFDYKEKE